MARGRPKKVKSVDQVRQEFVRTFIEDGFRERIGKAMVDLKMEIARDEELKNQINGAPLYVWVTLMCRALGIPRSRRGDVREVLVSRHLYVDEEGRAWVNENWVS